jgi:hypothetical protein
VWRQTGAAVLLLALALGATGLAGASEEADYAEQLVRARHIEGLPYSAARTLTPEGVARLSQMLADPAEARHHANIVAALGMSGRPEAFAALLQFAARAPQGELDRRAYRARLALPYALGHLARSDRRALNLLMWSVSAQAPAWGYRHLRGERLRRELQRAAFMALGASGRPEAEALLETEERRARLLASELRPLLAEARALRARVAAEGAAAVFAGEGPR